MHHQNFLFFKVNENYYENPKNITCYFSKFFIAIPEVAPVEASKITVGLPFPTSVERFFFNCTGAYYLKNIDLMRSSGRFSNV